ncbi:MAG: methyl coenzyme M reductase system, component A2 [Candidatus Methanomethyliaceae archaeon]|nr:methyl coenzyme M reductase system, component A2 [Candidatus Methanomethyliaceae archaeon]
MKEALIVVDGVSKKFNGNYVLKDVSLVIREGERVGILGKSGSGKSVLLSMLKGMSEYAPTSGKVIYRVASCKECGFVEGPSMVGKVCPRCCGRMELLEVDFWEDRESAKDIKNRIAIMFQRTFALYGSLTVYENFVEALEKVELDDVNIGRKALELAKRMGLEHRLLHAARDLSGGEKQRVVLGRQLAIRPILLLADEPTGTLDPLSARMVYRILNEEIKGKNITMLVTSHLPEAVEVLSERAILLEKGSVRATGNPRDIVKEFLSEAEPTPKEAPVETGGIILRVEGLKKHYFSLDKGVVRALDDVSFEVREGQIFGIVGMSGAGKTTLSRIIAGLTEPTSGRVWLRIGDEWVDMLQPGPMGRGRATPYIGLLHQEYSLYPHRTIQENLTDAIGLELPDEFAKFKAVMVLRAAGFQESLTEIILNKYPDELSEGERHRVALAQVLIREPVLVILDEPTGTMDPITQKDVSKSIKNARNELRQTFLIVSHDMGFVLNTCDEALLLRDGKIVMKGPVCEVVRSFSSEEIAELSQSKDGLPC